MNTRDFYMIGFNILSDIENYEGSKLTDEEGDAIKTVKNALARLYTHETMMDIRVPKGGESCELFNEKVMQRIPVFHKADTESLSRNE